MVPYTRTVVPVYTVDDLPAWTWSRRLRASQIANLPLVTLYLLIKPADRDWILIGMLSLSYLTFAMRNVHLEVFIAPCTSCSFLSAWELRRFVCTVGPRDRSSRGMGIAYRGYVTYPIGILVGVFVLDYSSFGSRTSKRSRLDAAPAR
jgi:hypothetical protein